MLICDVRLGCTCTETYCIGLFFWFLIHLSVLYLFTLLITHYLRHMSPPYRFYPLSIVH